MEGWNGDLCKFTMKLINHEQLIAMGEVMTVSSVSPYLLGKKEIREIKDMVVELHLTAIQDISL